MAKKKERVVPTKEEIIELFEVVAKKCKWIFDYNIEAEIFLEWFTGPKCKRTDWKATARNWARSMKGKNKYWQMNRNSQESEEQSKESEYSQDVLDQLFGDEDE